MDARLDCIPCVMKQALNVSRLLGHSKEEQEIALRKVIEFLETEDWTQTPPSIAGKTQLIVQGIKSTNGKLIDPYKDLKVQSNTLLLKQLSWLYEKLRSGENIFDRGMRMAVAGNIIDYASVSDFNITETIDTVLEQKFAIDDSEKLLEQLENARSLVYLTDNAGEIVLDFLFLDFIINELNPKINVTVIVKAEPTINDAMIADAEVIGLTKLPRVTMDTVIPITSDGNDGRDGMDFRKKLDNADVVISKGQGNFEALNTVPGIFFLLLVKCPVLAEDIGVELNSAVCYIAK